MAEPLFTWQRKEMIMRSRRWTASTKRGKRDVEKGETGAARWRSTMAFSFEDNGINENQTISRSLHARHELCRDERIIPPSLRASVENFFRENARVYRPD